MDQTRALNALQPYLALSKSATSPRAAADVITQATSAPNTYVFAELLATPSIQALKTCPDPHHASHYRLLELFAWGTWTDYNTNKPTLPELNAQQAHKLHLLSLLTLSSTAPSSSSLTYAHLTSALGLSSTRDLEALVTDAIYNSLLTATFDAKAQIVCVSSVAPLRDLAPGYVVDHMLGELDAWSRRCEDVLGDLEAEVERVKRDARERRKWESVREAQIAAANETKSTGSGQASTSGGGPAASVTMGGGGRVAFGTSKDSRSAGEQQQQQLKGLGVMDAGDDEDLMDLDDLPSGSRAKRSGGRKR